MPACPICESNGGTPSKPSNGSADTSAPERAAGGRQGKTSGSSTTGETPTGKSAKFSGVLRVLSATGARRLGLELIDAHGRALDGSDNFVIIMGERRWRAAQLAGLTELHALVLHGMEGDSAETFARAVAENVGRVDMTPLEEGRAFARLRDDFGYDLPKIAKVSGKSLNFVELRLDLLNLCLPMQDALTKGHIVVGLAWYASKLSPDNQARFLARHARGEFPTIREAEAFCQACRRAEEAQAQQGSFFIIADHEEAARAAGAHARPDELFTLDLGDEERERIAADRKKLTAKIERLGQAGQILAEIAAMDPAELALLLAGAPGGGIDGHRMRVDQLRDTAAKASTTLRQAKAIAAVRAGALQVAPDAVASTS